MKIKIFDRELDLHYSYRMFKIYEQVTEHSLDMFNIKIADMELLFFAAVIATLQYNKVDAVLGYTDFCNWIDDNGGDQLMVEFSQWFTSVMKAQADLMSESKDGVDGELDPNV